MRCFNRPCQHNIKLSCRSSFVKRNGVKKCDDFMEIYDYCKSEQEKPVCETDDLYSQKVCSTILINLVGGGNE